MQTEWPPASSSATSFALASEQPPPHGSLRRRDQARAELDDDLSSVLRAVADDAVLAQPQVAVATGPRGPGARRR